MASDTSSRLRPTLAVPVLVAIASLGTVGASLPAVAADAGLDGRQPTQSYGAGGHDLIARLSGEKEVPGPGDPNGRGRAEITLHRAQRKVCAEVTYRRIGDPIAAHIHRGGPRVSGDVVVDLSGAVTGGRECATGVRRALIRRIAQHPRRFYFNVHTQRYEAGAIRGQLRHHDHHHG